MFSWSYSDITLSHPHTQWLNQQTFSQKHKTSAQLLTQAHIHWKYHCVSTFIRSVNTLINLDIEVVLLHLAACGTRSVPARSNCTMKMIGGLWQCSSDRSLDSTGFFFFSWVQSTVPTLQLLQSCNISKLPSESSLRLWNSAFMCTILQPFPLWRILFKCILAWFCRGKRIIFSSTYKEGVGGGRGGLHIN